MKPDSETMHRSITSRDILGRWMGAMFVGEVIGLATATVFVRGVDLIGPLSGAGEVLSSLAASALAGALAGACLGVTQWLVLRRFFGDLSERAWVAASALGGALTSILGMLAAAQGPYDASSLWAVASGVLVVGIAVGAIVGGAQAWALRRHPQVAMRWLAANAAGWAIGSLVAYALTITDLDPLRYSLLFERFLNPERVSMPDFDIDFCMDRREEVIQYVQGKYGRDKVGQIITFGALLSKAAVRDVGRVLQMPYGQVDRLSKLIPVEGVKPVSIEKALADEPRLREAARAEEVVKRLLDYGQQIEGLLRNASTHAAGVVIGDRPLDELVPLYQDPRSDMPATQFNMKWVEAAGLVKFDFLGLKTLTVIQNAIELLKLRDIDVDISLIPLDDAKTYELYAAARTVAVFQVESTGMMDALRRMKPTCIEDIVALVRLGLTNADAIEQRALSALSGYVGGQAMLLLNLRDALSLARAAEG